MNAQNLHLCIREMIELNEQGEHVFKKNLGVTTRELTNYEKVFNEDELRKVLALANGPQVLDNQTFQQCPTPSASYIVVRSVILQTLVQLIDNVIQDSYKPGAGQSINMSSLKIFMHQSFKKDLIFAKKKD